MSPEGNYYYFEVTDFINSFTADTVTFRISYIFGDDAVSTSFPSKESDEEDQHPCMMADVALPNLPSSLITSQMQRDNISFVLSKQKDLVVQSNNNVTNIDVVSMIGNRVASKKNATSIHISYLSQGIYIAIITTDKGQVAKEFSVP